MQMFRTIVHLKQFCYSYGMILDGKNCYDVFRLIETLKTPEVIHNNVFSKVQLQYKVITRI